MASLSCLDKFEPGQFGSSPGNVVVPTAAVPFPISALAAFTAGGSSAVAFVGTLETGAALSSAGASTVAFVGASEARAALSSSGASSVAFTGSFAGGGAALDGLASVTGAWSLSRDLLTSFAGGTRYTKLVSAIITIEDQSGNNRDFSDQGQAGRRPVEATAFPNSILCADFDGVAHFLDTGIDLSNFIGNASGAIVVSVIMDAVTLNSGNAYQNHPIISDASQFAGLYAANASGVTFYGYAWDGTADQPSVTGATGTAYILMWRKHGGTIYVSVNGGAETSAANGNITTLTGDLIMSSGGNKSNMKVAEAFTTSDGSQTAALAAAVADFKAHVGA